jgi:hypothetical protein
MELSRIVANFGTLDNIDDRKLHAGVLALNVNVFTKIYDKNQENNKNYKKFGSVF